MAVIVSTMQDGAEMIAPDRYEAADISQTQIEDGYLRVCDASGVLVAAYAAGAWYSVKAG